MQSSLTVFSGARGSSFPSYYWLEFFLAEVFLLELLLTRRYYWRKHYCRGVIGPDRCKYCMVNWKISDCLIWPKNWLIVTNITKDNFYWSENSVGHLIQPVVVKNGSFCSFKEKGRGLMLFSLEGVFLSWPLQVKPSGLPTFDPFEGCSMWYYLRWSEFSTKLNGNGIFRILMILAECPYRCWEVSSRPIFDREPGADENRALDRFNGSPGLGPLLSDLKPIDRVLEEEDKGSPHAVVREAESVLRNIRIQAREVVGSEQSICWHACISQSLMLIQKSVWVLQL